MKYFWSDNKVAQVWFRNKRKPPEHNHKLITDFLYPSSYLQFGSSLCTKLFGQETPTMNKFAVLKLTKSYRSYSAKGCIFVNDTRLVSDIRQYCFERRQYLTLPGLIAIFDVDFYTYNYTYNVKLLGHAQPAKTENKEIIHVSSLNEDSKFVYVDLLMEMPSIALELFQVIPEVKPKKNEQKTI